MTWIRSHLWVVGIAIGVIGGVVMIATGVSRWIGYPAIGAFTAGVAYLAWGRDTEGS